MAIIGTTPAAAAAKRARRLDDYELAQELTRSAARAARFTSYSEVWAARGNTRAADEWADSAARAEDNFLACVEEARARLARQPDQGDMELSLRFFSRGYELATGTL